ncbi:unnamed protein product [Thelazia callipaeda]|uniref:Serine/threonine-protein kinase 1 n=1 Tax=Thelazia callipaeda TaxID=103827 RepID=A0A0N5D0A7_THECL|nr:unnamed protein product [Thelazia callipaeda]
MLRRRLLELTYCISYNVNFLHDKVHGAKQFRKKYKLLEELGRGGFGIVYKAVRNEDNAPVAVKFIEHKRVREWTVKCKQLIPTEICLLDICRNVPGVVRLLDWFANSKGFLIVMERPEQCMDLFDLISIYGYVDEDIARSIFLQLLNTTCLLYNTHGIFHRDIKDENIIINMDTGEATLVDFGAAALISEACIKEFQGTRSYCPPEWFKRLAYMPLEATVWSLGIVLYVMVSGRLPFQNEIQICLGRLIIPKHISKDCEHLLRQCLAVTPSRRPNLMAICSHRWLNQPVVEHTDSFKTVLQRNLQKRRQDRLSRCKESAENAIKNNDGNKLEAKDYPSTRIKRSSSDILNDARSITPLLPHINNVWNSELLKKHRRHSSYDNIVMSIRTDMFALRDCYDTDNNVLISPSSIEEESSKSWKHVDSSFCSISESFSMISADRQNSESYATALEDIKESLNGESKETAQSLPLTAKSNLNKEGVVQVNGPDRPENCNPSKKVMNSRLVAKHWPHKTMLSSKYRPLKLQRSTPLPADEQCKIESKCAGIVRAKP